MNEIVDYYDNLAKIYDSDRFENTYGKFIDSQERLILNKIIPSENKVVLDLACGSGRLLNYANYGVDASKEMLKITQDKYPDKFLLLADAANTTLKNNSIDVIICFHFFMHLNKDKLEKILEECDRILTKNGSIIFDIPSAKRRKAINYKSENWHGGFSLTLNEIAKLDSKFEIKKSFGLLFIPVHRIPVKFRYYFLKLDYFLSNFLLKEYSSYLIVEFVKK